MMRNIKDQSLFKKRCADLKQTYREELSYLFCFIYKVDVPFEIKYTEDMFRYFKHIHLAFWRKRY